MLFTEQFSLIKQLQHEKYLRHRAVTDQHEAFDKKIKQIKAVVEKLHRKYGYLFSTDRKIRAVGIIQSFVKKRLFNNCINDENLCKIPEIYRFRVDITDYHFVEYSEDKITIDIEGHRRLHQIKCFSATGVYIPTIIFTYCFDVREIYPIKNKIIFINDMEFYFQPDDHSRLNNLWRKVRGDTSESIIYLNQFEYFKALSIDAYKND